MADAESFDARLLAFVRAYVRFATEHAALLELMFAGKHRPGADRSLRVAADRAFEAPLALIAEGQAGGEIVAGDPEGVGIVAFAAAARHRGAGQQPDARRTTSTRWSPPPSSD